MKNFKLTKPADRPVNSHGTYSTEKDKKMPQAYDKLRSRMYKILRQMTQLRRHMKMKETLTDLKNA